MAGGGGKGVMDNLKAQLAAGADVEVAGYRLGSSLASGIEAARLVPAGVPGRLEWLDLSTSNDAALSPASEQALQSWRAAGWRVRAQVVRGPSFWATSEIELAQELITRTVEAL